jgi:hypothetical protein
LLIRLLMSGPVALSISLVHRRAPTTFFDLGKIVQPMPLAKWVFTIGKRNDRLAG